MSQHDILKRHKELTVPMIAASLKPCDCYPVKINGKWVIRRISKPGIHKDKDVYRWIGGTI